MWTRFARRPLPVVAFVLAIALVAGSSLRVIGDGPDYVGTSLNLVDGRGTAMTRAEAAALQDRFAALGPPLAQWDVEGGTLRNRRGHREFGHFWLYSAAAAPFVAAALPAGASPLAGFTVLNILLYTAAWWVVAGRASWRMPLLVLAGPIVWWLDKAHTEVFTVAMLTIAAALLRTHPWWAAVAAAVAATQNPPLAVLALGALALTLRRGRAAWRSKEIVAAAALAVALVALHPAYYLIRFGTVSPLVGFSTRRIPTVDEIGLVVWDPSLGLAGSWPVLLLAVLVAVVVIARRARDVAWLELLVAGAAVAAVLMSVAQTQNPVHGGTPGMSRYALWLGPLLLPVLLEADRLAGRASRAAFALLAAASAVIGIVAFHPSRGELSHRPTIAASWIWNERPAWNNPLPAVFAGSLEPHGRQRLPVAALRCRKILLIGESSGDAMWPAPCPPFPVPERCRERGSLCYANATQDGYTFEPVPRRYWQGFSRR